MSEVIREVLSIEIIPKGSEVLVFQHNELQTWKVVAVSIYNSGSQLEYHLRDRKNNNQLTKSSKEVFISKQEFIDSL